MKLLFLCGGLQPGQDGVGDYTRRLAGELIKRGNQCTIIAMNDPDILEAMQSMQREAMLDIHVLRLPRTLSWKMRLKQIREWINAEDPEWISLQFVPFAYQKKGLPIFLAKRLKRISAGIKWHIMVHEIWVGKESLKHLILGAIQKLVITDMLQRIDAAVIHTHLPLYFDELSKIAKSVKKLPLYPNFHPGERCLPLNPKKFRVGFFNQVGAQKNIIDFLLKLQSESVNRNLEFEILVIGGALKTIKPFKHQLEAFPEFNNRVYCTGFLENSKVVDAISTCNIGMTPLMSSALGKSGTSAAFLSQGIPMAVPTFDHSAKSFFDDDLICALVTEPTFENIEVATNAAKKSRNLLSLTKITDTFLYDLNSSH